MAFGFNSTTDDVLSGCDLSSKIVMVTGASSGLGEETARAMAVHGADVTIVARSTDKLKAAAERIRSVALGNVEIGALELDKPESIRAFTLDWLSRHNKLDILINNAGIMGTPFLRTPEGWELQFATNHLGHFLLTGLLLPALKAAAPARVVNLSSAGHWFSPVVFDDIHFEHRDYDKMLAYGQSKTANIWFATELNRRLSPDGVTSFAVHPGGIKTDLSRHLSEEDMQNLLALIEEAGVLLKTIPQGAATSCWAAVSPELNGKGGLYLEDCHIAEVGKGSDMMSGGYASHAYDADGARRLWTLSNELLGTSF